MRYSAQGSLYSRQCSHQFPFSGEYHSEVLPHVDGYVAYPLGLKGVVVGEGDSYEEALADVKSAIRFHLETFGPDIVDTDSPVLEAFVAEAGVALS